MNLPGHTPSLAPGMSQVIEAGQVYVIKDDKNQEYELVGRDRPWVLEFLETFSTYMDACDELGTSSVVAQSMAMALHKAWRNIPADLVNQLPSQRARGVRVG